MKILKSMVSKIAKKIIALLAVLFWLFLFAPQTTLAHSFADLPGHTYTSLGVGCNSAADCTTYYNLSCDVVNKYCSLIKSSWAGSPAATTTYPSLNCFYNGAPAIALCGEINCNITNPQANPRGECLYGKPDKSGTSIIETGFVQGTPTPEEPKKPFELLNPFANLQIKIPGLDKLASETPATCETIDGKTSCSLPWISVYIKALYNYAMGVVGILAALALMIGGVIYLTSTGNATRISEAKSWITGALTGMLIMFTSYVLLNEVNPDLIGFKSIKLSIVTDELGQEDPTGTMENSGVGFGEPGNNGVPYFSQKNSAWEKIVWKKNGFQDIKRSACGPTSVSMIAKYYGINTDPLKTVRCACGGSPDSTTLCADKPGIQAYVNGINKCFGSSLKYQAITADKVMATLREGKKIVALTHGIEADPGGGNCPFTTHGHYIVLTGLNPENGININDPFPYTKPKPSSVTLDFLTTNCSPMTFEIVYQ